MTAIDEVKARIDIAELISPYTPLRKSGRGLSGRCPFHEEKTPSFYVYPDEWSYHCFGCGAHGDGFTFLMQKDGLSFGDALRTLADRAGVVVPERTRDPQAAEAQRRLSAITEAAAAYFVDSLRKPAAEGARMYLAGRGLDKPAIDAFGLGYAPDSWDALLRYLGGLGYKPEEIATAGLAIARENAADEGRHHYDRFRNRVVVPIRDRQGKAIAFGARALAADQVPKYLNSPETPLFHKGDVLFGLDRAARGIQDQDQAVIVEGYFDAITAHRAGFTNVIASMGTSLTERQVRLLTRLTKRIVLALDADAAGQEATLRGLSVVQAAADERVVPLPTWQGYVRLVGRSDVDLRVLTLPIGKDPDELIRAAPDLWRALVADAPPVVDHLFASVMGRLDTNDPAAKSKAAETLLPAIQALDDPIRQGHYVRKLAEALGVDERALLDRQRGIRTNVPPKAQPASPARPPVTVSADTRLEHYALGVVLRYPDLDPAALGLTPDLFAGEAERQVLLDRPGEDHTLDDLRERILTVPLPPMEQTQAEASLREVAARLQDRRRRQRIRGGGATADTPNALANADDEMSKLLAAWKAKEQRP